MGALGIALVLAVVFGAIFADVLTPFDPTKIAPRDRFLPPGAAHLLGTDQLGRDLFTRVLHGARIALVRRAGRHQPVASSAASCSA